MSGDKDEWYVSRGGQTFGPVPFEKVIEAAKEGKIEPRTDMLFGGDLEDWTQAGQVEGVFKKSEPQAEGGEEGAVAQKEEALVDSGDFDFEKDTEHDIDLPGARRLGYFLGVTLLPGVLTVGLYKAMPLLVEQLGNFGYGPFALLAYFIIPIVMLVVTLKRFQNLGMSGWWILGFLVPFLPLWLKYRLYCCPAGYAFTKKLDVGGKILAVIYWLLTVLYVGAIALICIKFGALVADEARQEDFQEYLQKFENQIDSMKQAVEDKKKGESESP